MVPPERFLETASPSLGGVHRTSSPASSVLWGAQTPCCSFRRASLPSRGDTTLAPGLLPAAEAHDRGLRGVDGPVPEPELSVETTGSLRFLGNPCVPLPCSWTPVGPRTPGPYGASTWPPLVSTTKAPAMERFRGSITRPWDWLSTLRPGGHPTRRKTRFRLLGPAWPGGILLPAGLRRKVSEFESLPPFPGLS